MNQFLIDGFNLAFRAHYAFNKFTTSTGLFSGCIYGFLTILKSLKNKYPTFQFYVAWDRGSNRRKALYPEYKSNRQHFNIDQHIRDLQEALRYLNVIQVESVDEEADDVLATLARKGKDQVFIYSSDKDLMQLVRDGRVILIRPKVGATPERVYDEEAVKKEFGVSPYDLACFLALRGDAVDNIPGVPSVPSKVLAALASKYKQPEHIYEGLETEKLTDFQRNSIVASQAQICLNYRLTTLDNDVDCTTVFGKSNVEGFRKIVEKYEIKAIKPDDYVPLFDRDTSFLMRTDHKKVETESLFD